MYLLTIPKQEKVKYFKGKHPPSTNMDTFGYFRWMIKTGMEFNTSHPLLTQAIENGEVDPSVEVDLAVMIMETWSNAIGTYVLNEGMKQKDIMKWARSAKTRETVEKMLYVMEYGLHKTESEFVRRP
jgi:hypothetical protein